MAQLAGTAPRRYRLVVLSDHGQSQGTPFADRYGQTLGDLCADLMHEQVQNVDASVEGLGRADSLAGDISAGGMTGKLAGRADEVLTKAQETSAPGDAAEEPVVVLGSGNLGLVYVRGDRRWTLEALEQSVAGPGPRPGRAPRRRVRRRHR